MNKETTVIVGCHKCGEKRLEWHIMCLSCWAESNGLDEEAASKIKAVHDEDWKTIKESYKRYK